VALRLNTAGEDGGPFAGVDVDPLTIAGATTSHVG
jgi:hypothetical protein